MGKSQRPVERIGLEPLARRHADELFGALLDLRIYRFIPQEPPASLEALRERYGFLEGGGSPPGGELWLNWVIRRARDAAAVGTVQATVEADSAWIAYEVLPEYWRLGYGASACRRMLDLLRAENGVEVALAKVDTRNEASVALLESLGFDRVRTLPNADFFKGAPSDEYEYRLELLASPTSGD